MGAVAWGLWPTLRFPSPLIEPDVPISGIRLVWGFLCQGRHAIFCRPLSFHSFGRPGRGGSLTEIDLNVKRRPAAVRTDEDTVALLRRPAVHYPDAVIAGILNRQERRTAYGHRLRPAQALLTLRPTGSLSRPRRPLSRGRASRRCSGSRAPLRASRQYRIVFSKMPEGERALGLALFSLARRCYGVSSPTAFEPGASHVETFNSRARIDGALSLTHTTSIERLARGLRAYELCAACHDIKRRGGNRRHRLHRSICAASRYNDYCPCWQHSIIVIRIGKVTFLSVVTCGAP
jgi:hypothetical protein